MNPQESLFSLDVLFLIIGVSIVAISLRVLMGRQAWPFHPNSLKGYVTDEAIRMLAVLVPAIVFGFGLRFFMISANPSQAQSIWILPIGVIGIMLITRYAGKYISPVQKASERIMNARHQAYLAKSGSPKQIVE